MMIYVVSQAAIKVDDTYSDIGIYIYMNIWIYDICCICLYIHYKTNDISDITNNKSDGFSWKPVDG